VKADLQQTQSSRAPKRTASHRKPAPIRAIRIETILVPIDFSSASLQTIRWARFIARRTNAAIHLVHVHDFELSLFGTGGPMRKSAKAIQNCLYRDLKDVAVRHNVPNANARYHILTGHAFQQICELAGKIHADLIVMSTHGRTGWRRVFLGSAAERVVQYAPCPVLIARQSRANQKRALKLKKIVVPIDFSECSAEGLDYALKLARAFGAELSLLHALHIYHYDTPVVVYTVGELNRFAREGAEERMAELVRSTNFGDVEFETLIKMGRQTGSAARTICHYAERTSADLIVTCTHGRTGLPHVLIGSVAEQIVRYAKAPVLVVPAHARQQHHFSH
jgi:nucleotide-binding universal stress UspA family protein